MYSLCRRDSLSRRAGVDVVGSPHDEELSHVATSQLSGFAVNSYTERSRRENSDSNGHFFRYTIMVLCWNHAPSERPNFKKICRMLEPETTLPVVESKQNLKAAEK